MQLASAENRAPAPRASGSALPKLAERLDALDDVPLPRQYVSGPQLSGLTPTAFGYAWGTVGVGFIVQQSRYSHPRVRDGAVGAVIGLGEPAVLGVDAAVSILDLRPDAMGRGGFGQRGSFAFKIHRPLSPRYAVAVGLDNVLNWGGTDVPWSTYVVASARTTSRTGVSGRFHGSVGLGTGRFRSERAVTNGTETIGVFGSAGWTVARPLRAFVEWTGQDLGVGVSLVPLRSVPLSVTTALLDVAGSAGDGARPMVSAAYLLTMPRKRP